MKALLLLLCCLVPILSFAQIQNPGLLARDQRMNQSGCHQLHLAVSKDSCATATALAERDIQASTPFLILASGDAPVSITTDPAFEQRFRVEYYEMGCLAPDRACMLAYNSRIFSYLQATYGKAWQRQVRPDVVGLKQWRRTH